jgi:hypothetical protein
MNPPTLSKKYNENLNIFTFFLNNVLLYNILNLIIYNIHT